MAVSEAAEALLAAELPAELELERVGVGRFHAHHRDLRREAVQDLVEPSPESNVEISGLGSPVSLRNYPVALFALLCVDTRLSQ